LTPEGLNPKALLKILREQDHVVLGGGQEHLDGKIFRVGHLGFFQEAELIEAMDAVEKRLSEPGLRG
jgi:aspartate aminotransferase-like enzyme